MFLTKCSKESTTYSFIYRSLSGRDISIAKGAFNTNTNMATMLSIYCNMSRSFVCTQSDTFASFVHVLSCVMYRSISGRIQSLPKNIFATLTNLLTLDMGSTGLTYLDEDLISSNTDLFYLRLENNELYTIPPNFFRNNDKLHTITLDDNDIHKLNYDVFKPLRSLESIHLQRNKNLEMYCDYHFTNKSIFPGLEAMYAMYIYILTIITDF